MKEILPGFYQIDEAGTYGQVYLWEWEQGATLIDLSLPGKRDAILGALRDNGYPLHTIKRIILTHGDVDHIGAAADIRRATGAVITCHTVEKQLLESPKKRPSRNLAQAAFFAVAFLMPVYSGVRPVTPDELIVDGDLLPEGFIVIHTPGHTPGHISLLHKEKRLLIAGDALWTSGSNLKVSMPPITADMKNAQRSVWKLAKKHGDDFDTIVFGHGEPILKNGGARVKALASQIFSTEV